MSKTPTLDFCLKYLYFKKEFRFEDCFIRERFMKGASDWIFRNFGKNVFINCDRDGYDIGLQLSIEDAIELDHKIKESKDKFEQKWIENSQITLKDFLENNQIVVPCICNESICQGWMVDTKKQSDILTFEPSSVDNPDTYHWFQSKYRHINKITTDIQNILKLTVSKSTEKELINYFEDLFELERTKEQDET